jgi:hypothetical protein
MHTSLDQALGRPPRPNRVGQSILNIGGNASAAYSLRSLTGGEPKAVRIRRDGDNEERDFTTAEIGTEAAAWTNGLQETTLPADLPSTSSSITGFTISGTADEASTTYSSDGTLLNGKLLFTYSSGDYNVQVRYDGSKWLIWDNFQSEAFWTPTNNQDTEFPWDVTAWTENTGGGGPPVFSSFVGGNPDNSAAAAYSLRKVKSDYTGPAVRIRRTSDDIDADVAFDTNDTVSNDSIVTEVLSGNQSTLQAFISGTNAAVAIWYDQSGSSNNATQTTDANQPLIAAGGNLLTAGITFDGTDDFLATDQSVITQSSAGSFSYFGVSTIATDEAGYIFGSAGNGTTVGSSLYAQDVSNFSLSNGNIVQRDNITRSSGENLVSACYTGSRANLRVNGGGTSVTESTYNFNANSNFTIGNREDGSSAAARVLAGSIKEIIAYDSDQTNNRFKIESNINNHYEIYIPAEDGFVNTWYDQSGNGNHATQATADKQPKIVSAGALLNELDFDGNDFLSSSNIGAYQSSDGIGFFCAFSKHAASTSDSFTGTNPQYLLQLRKTNLSDTTFAARVLGGKLNVIRANASGNTFLSTLSNAHTIGTNLVLSSATGTLGVDLFENGSELALSADSSGASFDSSSTQLIIGSQDITSRFLDGNIKELILYTSDQSANRPAIEANMINHYGIS